MDSHTPADSAAPAPRDEVLDSVAAQIAATDELIALARRSIRVFDVDLVATGWNGRTRTDRLAAFLRSSRHARLDIIVHDVRHIERDCPRLCALLQRFGDLMTILRTSDEAREAMDPLLLVDDRHFIHRFHADAPRAALGIDQPQAAKALIERFDALWVNGEPGLTGTVLGL